MVLMVLINDMCIFKGEKIIGRCLLVPTPSHLGLAERVLSPLAAAAAASSPRRRLLCRPRQAATTSSRRPTPLPHPSAPTPPKVIHNTAKTTHEQRERGRLGFLRRHPSPPRRRGAPPQPLSTSSATDAHRRLSRPGPSPPPLFPVRNRQIGAAPPRAPSRPPFARPIR